MRGWTPLVGFRYRAAAAGDMDVVVVGAGLDGAGVCLGSTPEGRRV